MSGRAEKRSPSFRSRIRALREAIQNNDEEQIEQAILHLSQSRKLFAPLGFAIGAFVLLFNGVKLLVTNWRLTLVQILPAMWIWAAMFNLKVHLLHGKSFNPLRGPILIPLAALVIALTVASFFLNAVFAFAVAQGPHPQVRPAYAEARRHPTPIVASAVVVGALLAFSTLIVTRWPRPWFALSLGITVGLMMISYVTVPARMIGARPVQSRRDRLVSSALGGILGATICTPPYLLGRLGILMLGSKVLFIPGIIFIAVGVTLQSGATGAVRAVKMSVKLTPREATAQQPRPPELTPSGG